MRPNNSTPWPPNHSTDGWQRALKPPLSKICDRTAFRPIGIPSFEDKVLQRAVAMVLEGVYEQDFLDCSYGFRPKRSPHQALDAFRQQVMAMWGGWVIKIDIKSYFDTISHHELRVILDKRVRDGVIRRTIDKWLKAGVLENGGVTRSDTGVPQGSGVSPILSNLFLHEVLDTWFEDQVTSLGLTLKPRLKGKAALCRFADDAVIICAHQRDAQRVIAVLPKRFEKYGLTLHPEKTRMIRFTQPPRGAPARRRQEVPTVAWVGGPARLHPVLGEVTTGHLGGEVQDGFRSAKPCPEAD